MVELRRGAPRKGKEGCCCLKNKSYALWSAYVVVAVLIAAIALCIVFEWPVFWGIAAGCAAAAFFVWKQGSSIKELWKMSVSRLSNVKGICVMLFFIGGTIGFWMASGVIGTFVYGGLKYLSGLNMVLVAFLLCSALSCILGTAMGTLSTMGVVFIGIAQALGIHMPLMAGAVISGCYLADRTAPLSAVLNLVSSMTGTDMPGNIKYMGRYTLMGLGICSLFYYWAGRSYAGADLSGVTPLLSLLKSSYTIHWLMLLPLVLMVLLVLAFRRSIVTSLLISLGVSVALAFAMTDLSFAEMARNFVMGFHPADAQLARVISGSGVLSMVNVILSVIFSAVLNGLMEGGGMINLLLDRLNKPTQNEGRLMANAGLTSILLTLVTCNQPICAMATGMYFSPKFDEMKITRRALAHIISDNGIIVSPLIPWNVNAMMAVSITGVAALRFAPYCMLCYVLPIFTWINMMRASRISKKERPALEKAGV